MVTNLARVKFLPRRMNCDQSGQTSNPGTLPLSFNPSRRSSLMLAHWSRAKICPCYSKQDEPASTCDRCFIILSSICHFLVDCSMFNSFRSRLCFCAVLFLKFKKKKVQSLLLPFLSMSHILSSI